MMCLSTSVAFPVILLERFGGGCGWALNRYKCFTAYFPEKQNSISRNLQSVQRNLAEMTIAELIPAQTVVCSEKYNNVPFFDTRKLLMGNGG